MRRGGSWILAPFALALLTTLAACGSSSPATSPSAAGCTLTVDITATGGTVWGVVTAKAGGQTHTLSQASQSLSVPCGSAVTLTQSPTNTATWPFASWTVNGDKGQFTNTRETVPDLQLKVDGDTTVTAVYTTPSGSSNSSGGW